MLALVRHPCAPLSEGVSLEAACERSRTGAWEFRYLLRAEGAAFTLLAPLFSLCTDRTLRRADRLWEHTCFEAFLASANRSDYREFNFSPSGDWAAYDFSDYRQGRADAAVGAPKIRASVRPPWLELRAVVAHGDGAAFSDETRVGLSAVVETPGGLTYWALRHVGEHPDFHRRDGFLCEPGRD
ncbi:MAG: DOMON-like domain-containing protein [Candidatus Accumulibacter sp.]|nr:DOMON-like domain-containing protein [Accumulibacter sp.]